jgi:diguanylate cyclase (GGDEF)-like protein
MEIVFQITAQLDVENIVKHMAWSFISKFGVDTVTFLLAKDIDEEAYEVLHYAGTRAAEADVQMDSIATLLVYFDQEEYNQASFAHFREHYPDERTVRSLEALSTDIIVPLRTDRGVSGVVLLPASGSGEAYSTSQIQYITRILRFASVALENANLYWQATTDRMTKLYSHHFFQKTLEDEIMRGQRLGSMFSLIMFDIDHFKNFNDTYGHLQGDTIIKEIARLLMGSTRNIDVCARYGGEEFAVILPGVGLEGAELVASRLRASVEEHEFSGREGVLHVTISLGVTEFHRESMKSASQMVASADAALYTSKNSGRNRVTAVRGAQE